MKRVIYILLAVLPLLAGCESSEFKWSTGDGTPIKFSANTYYENGVLTKTEYSGKDENNNFVGSTSQYERIDWVNNDLMRIWVTDGSTSENGDYKVTGHEMDSAHNQIDNATVVETGDPLNWIPGSGEHKIYSLYPSPATTGVDAKVSLSGNVITATLPSAQTVTAASGSKVYKPNMNYAYMWAATSATPGSDVTLGFKPLMTAFEFTVGTGEGKPSATIKSFSLTATSTAPYLTGDFTATINEALTGYTVSNITGGSREISVSFGSGVEVSYASPMTFTVFALPHDLSGLTMSFTFADNTTKSVKLGKTTGGTFSYQTFLAAKKYRITNVYLPEQETFTYTIEQIDDITTYGHVATTTSTTGLPFTVKSYKTSSLTGATTPVTWKLKFQKANGEWTYDITEAAYYGQLSTDIITGSGGTSGESVRADIARSHTDDEYHYYGEIEDAATAALRAKSPLPSATSDAGDGYFDLSKHPVYGTIDGAEQSQETANCYVISAPGKYKLPLVYGNALRNGSTNAVSYRPTLQSGVNDNDHYMRQFLRHDDNPIQGPWITTDNGISVSDAVVVWQDGSESADMQILFNSDISVSGNYIFFEIKKEKIRPGNILLAARNSSGTIVWSWHIWVTNKDLTPVSVKDMNNVTHGMMGFNLGWTDAKTAGGYKWDDWDIPVKVVQIEGGVEVGDTEQFTISQLGESGEVDANVGSNGDAKILCYQQIMVILIVRFILILT